MSSQQKVAIITGASQGIGAGLVRGFVDKGFKVIANSRSIQSGAFEHPDVVEIAGDISDPKVAEHVVQEAVKRFGRVDTLINNAGIFVPKPFVDYTAEEYSRVMDVNVSGFFYVTQQAIRHMLKQGHGHVVQVTTTLVDQPIKGVTAALASLSKGALSAVTKGLAIEYADQGIRVNAIAPGIIRTPMHQPEQHEFLAGLHPIHRLGEVQEVVDAVLYLESAGFVTGEVIHIDGGAHAGKW